MSKRPMTSASSLSGSAIAYKRASSSNSALFSSISWSTKSTALETVAELPGLASPCTMECGESLLTAFGLGFTPHIQRQTRPDLRLRPHPVDTLLHLAIAPVAPLHGIRGGGQQRVIKKRQGLFQGGREELFEGCAHLWEPQE